MLEQKIKESNELSKNAQKALRDVLMHQDKVENLEKTLNRLIPKYKDNFRIYESYLGLNKLVNRRGANFVQYVLSIYFKKVLNKANQKLNIMTDGLYQFRQPEAGKINVEIFDASSGTQRALKTLSGGETFLASLALALGFSEVVEEENGGIRLDTIFIDEGFGSLDPDYLDRSIEVLTRLSNDRRVILISHVEQLKDRIEQKILVNKTSNGTCVEVVS